jgi:23S rRNA pseudouridine2605 synthase
MNETQREVPDAGEPTTASEPRGDADASPGATPSPGADNPPPGGDAAGGPEGGGNDRRRNRNRRRGRRGGVEGGEGPQGVPIEAAVLVGEDGEPVVPEEPTAAPEEAAPVETPSAGDRFADVISGAYDSESTEEPTPEGPAAERRVLAPEPDAPKLHKVLAQAGVGSRRDMEQLIADGRIVVNGQVAHVGQRITAGDQVRVDGKIVRLRIMPPPARVLAYHKPAGEIVTHGEPQNRPTVFRRLPRLPHGKWQSVGRLDINTEGLLLFTNSGELANQLMHPRFGIEREYAVRVLGTLDDESKEHLLEGVDIEGQRAAFRSIDDGGGEGANHWYRVVINEGRNREVRNLFAAVGLTVSRLIRIRYGCVVLPRGLKRGVWVDLSNRDVGALQGLLGMRRQQPHPGPQGNDKGNRRRGRRGRGGREGDRGAERPVEPRTPGHDHDIADFGAIPNPLQQTYDRRAIREARQPRREYAEDGPIPNPLEQTYDKRFVQKQRGAGGGRKGGGDNNQRQPDPMQTSVGYIGADAFHKKMAGGGGGGGGRGRRRR